MVFISLGFVRIFKKYPRASLHQTRRYYMFSAETSGSWSEFVETSHLHEHFDDSAHHGDDVSMLNVLFG